MKLNREQLRLTLPLGVKQQESSCELQVEILDQLLREACASPEQRLAAWEFWIAKIQEWEPEIPASR